MSRLIDLTGHKFGKLTVVGFPTHVPDKEGVYWKCVCECGNECLIRGKSLRNGHTKSCGCLIHDILTARNIKHGLSKNTSLYGIWKSMKTRCYNVNRSAYKYYGGRGIGICEEWKDDFVAFYNWSISNGYSVGLTIDRIDNDGNYSPDNCRWVSKDAQQSNRRYCIPKIMFEGESHTLSEISKILGINYSTLYARIHNYGWDIEKAITTPVD